ncbi:MAG: hypothetical protein M3Y72_01185 [Acidobacteriota bacterium]|nr:hypothetical protein [Acidobacteriota bacterium]MDQ2839658.1 hypothetical protein [Acidobacteriota bacterium]
MHSCFWRLAFTSVLCFACPAFGATIEGFENLSQTLNSPIPAFAPGSDYLAIGALSPYSFSSRVIFSDPVPNGEASMQGSGALVIDFSINDGNGSFGLGSDNINNSTQLPGGSAFLAWDGAASLGSPTFRFSTPVDSVGAFVDAGSGDIVETAYDAHGRALSSSSVSAVNLPRWRINFVSVSANGISSVSFNGDHEVIDNLTFSAPPPSNSPEPASIGLVGLILTGLGLAFRFRKLHE